MKATAFGKKKCLLQAVRVANGTRAKGVKPTILTRTHGTQATAAVNVDATKDGIRTHRLYWHESSMQSQPVSAVGKVSYIRVATADRRTIM